MANVGIISQVRMSSTRLPGKVLKEVKGKILLDYHLDRLLESGYKVIVATTTNDADNVIESHCRSREINVFRGSEDDVLERFYLAAKENHLDVIVRVTSDCPLIDGNLLKQEIDSYVQKRDFSIYKSNCQKRTFPRGFDFEIFSFNSLERAHKEATLTSDREHVTPYIWKGNIKDIKFQDVLRSEDKSDYRITVDTIEDYNLILELIGKFDCEKLNADQIIEILNNNKQLVEINQSIEQKKV